MNLSVPTTDYHQTYVNQPDSSEVDQLGTNLEEQLHIAQEMDVSDEDSEQGLHIAQEMDVSDEDSSSDEGLPDATPLPTPTQLPVPMDTSTH